MGEDGLGIAGQKRAVRDATDAEGLAQVLHERRDIVRRHERRAGTVQEDARRPARCRGAQRAGHRGSKGSMDELTAVHGRR